MIATDAQTLITKAKDYTKIQGVLADQVISWLMLQWANAPTLQPSPVLAIIGGLSLSWTSSYVPAFWNCYASSDGVTYSLFSTVAGSMNSVGIPPSNHYFYVQGYTGATGTATTLPSNIVHQ